MIERKSTDAASQRLLRALAPTSSPMIPLDVDGGAVGWITPERIARLAQFPDVFVQGGEALRFARGLDDCPSRSKALARVAKALRDEGALTAWRDELYAVSTGFEAPPLFLLERAAARYFGVHTYAAHVNGLVHIDGETRMWLARRAPDKAIDPGMLDNLVGGGIAAGATVAQTVVKEAWEEAGIAASLAATARHASSLEIRREQPDGLHWETIFVHDLRLPADFVPVNQDGEAVDHRSVSLPEVMDLIAQAAGPDAMTADSAFVAFDCLARLGMVDAAAIPAQLAAAMHAEPAAD